MNEFESVWTRLTRLTRRALAAGEPDLAAPAGFSARVAAHWMAEVRPARTGAAWDWLAVKGLGIACVLAVLVVLAGWPLATSAVVDDVADLADPLVVADLSE